MPGLAILGVLALAACGSDSGPAEGGTPRVTAGAKLSTQEYFDGLKAAFDRLEQAVAASANPNTQITDPAQLLPVIQQAMTGLEQAIAPFIDEVRALNPPEVLAETHRDLLEALEKDKGAISDVAEQVRAAQDLGQAQAAFESRRNALVESRAPCEALEQIARREGIAVALPCQE